MEIWGVLTHEHCFHQNVDRGYDAGIKPILHSTLGFLPRYLAPDKPHPSTLYSNDIYSKGMYLIYKEMYGYGTGSMVEPNSGAHAYWEFGWLGVAISPFLTVSYIALFPYYYQYFDIASLPLIMATFKPFGYVDPKIWFSDVIMQFYQICLPFLLLAFVLELFHRSKSFRF